MREIGLTRVQPCLLPACGAPVPEMCEGDAPLASRLCTGACLGVALLGLIGFALALLIGLNDATLAVTALLLAMPLLLLRNSSVRNHVENDITNTIKAISRATTQPNRWDFIY